MIKAHIFYVACLKYGGNVRNRKGSKIYVSLLQRRTYKNRNVFRVVIIQTFQLMCLLY